MLVQHREEDPPTADELSDYLFMRNHRQFNGGINRCLITCKHACSESALRLIEA